MNKVVTRWAMQMAVVGIVATCLFGTAAQAEEKLRVGVVDMRKVIVEGKGGAQRNAELDKMVKERKEKLAKEESNIKLLHEKLEKDKLVLSDKQKEEKQKEINDKVASLQKAAQLAEQEVQKRNNELLGEALNVVAGISAEVAKQEKLSLVMDRNQSGLVWAQEQIDITEKVAKAYEAKFK